MLMRAAMCLLLLGCGRTAAPPVPSAAGETCGRTADCVSGLRCVAFQCLEAEAAEAAKAAGPGRRSLPGTRSPAVPAPAIAGGVVSGAPADPNADAPLGPDDPRPESEVTPPPKLDLRAEPPSEPVPPPEGGQPHMVPATDNPAGAAPLEVPEGAGAQAQPVFVDPPKPPPTGDVDAPVPPPPPPTAPAPK